MKQTSTLSNFDILTGRNNPGLVEFDGLQVHAHVVDAFTQLQATAKKEIDADIQLVSAFRGFEKQKSIWNAKCSGQRNILDDNNNIIQCDSLAPLDLVHAIMRFSAIPGASRHHWGTDIDIYDASKKKRENVQLTHSEAMSDFLELNKWLDNRIKDNNCFNFFRPYDQDLGGIAIEKWHLSFTPLAQKYYEQYTIDVFIKNIEESDIKYKDILLEHAKTLFDRYISNIILP